MSAVAVTFDGDTHWLECFADDLDAEDGDLVAQVDAGTHWDELLAKVAAHQAEHGCAP